MADPEDKYITWALLYDQHTLTHTRIALSSIKKGQFLRLFKHTEEEIWPNTTFIAMDDGFWDKQAGTVLQVETVIVAAALQFLCTATLEL